MDLAVERELLKRKLAEGANPLSGAVGKAELAAHEAAVRARGYWIAARKQAFDRNYEASQTEPSSPLEIRRAKRDGADGSWDAQPRLVDFEDSFGRALDELQPDLIHANDADMLGIAARAALRARARGRTVKIVYDAHEYFAGETRKGDASWTAAMAAQERRYLPFADGVSVAAESFVEALTSLYGLQVPPTVVSNMPNAIDGPTAAASADPGVRELLGLGPEVPLLVHAGAVTPVRGLDTVVRALVEVPAAHFVLVAGTRAGHVADLVQLADSLGCGDRFHVLDYVEPDKLTAYLSSATLGVEPLLRTPHHDLTVTTKFWSYVNARLPILMSDVEEMARLVREMGNGEVFTAGDVSAAAATIGKLIADPAGYASVYDSPEFGRFTWESEAEKLLALYTSVTGLDPKPAVAGEAAETDASATTTDAPATTTEGDDADV